MKEYNVYFSFYSEMYGSFDCTPVKIKAENQFDARRMAWENAKDNDNLEFASCLKICGITWDASTLDIQDYFNAQAANDKYKLQYIENVEIPNAKIERDDEKINRFQHEKAEYFSSLYTIQSIASDFGKAHGMLPPTIYEELHYAREFLSLIEDFERYNVFDKLIINAEKWDSTAIMSIRDSFKYGLFDFRINGGDLSLNFSEQFNRDGLYPVYADREDTLDYKYIRRWSFAQQYKNAESLPVFDEKDVVKDSHSTQYCYQTLVIKVEALPHEQRTPLNSLWVANQDSAGDYDKDGGRPIEAENPFTGEIAEFKRTDFIGVLLPERCANIDFDGIKASCQEQARKAENSRASDIDAEKPSILKTVEDNKRKIAEAVKPESREKAQKQNKSHNSIDD